MIVDPTLTYNLIIDGFSICVTLIVYFCYVRYFPKTYDLLLLRKMQLAILLTLALDIGAWCVNGIPQPHTRLLKWGFSMAHFIMQAAVMTIWWQYAFFHIHGRRVSKKEKMAALTIPFALLSALILTTPFTRWYFYVDEANLYHRGIWWRWLFIAHFAYPITAAALAARGALREEYHSRRDELYSLVIFLFLPLAGAIGQMLIPQPVSLVWPCTVLSSLIILATKSSEAILLDQLTGLNNRRGAERLFQNYEKSAKRSFALLLLDLDHFKETNDTCGHGVGDLALMATADILRAVFSGSTAFLSRYGGDEFLVVLPQGGRLHAEEAIARIQAGFESYRLRHDLLFTLECSIGYAVSSADTPRSPMRLLKDADADLYRVKAEKAAAEQEAQAAQERAAEPSPSPHPTIRMRKRQRMERGKA